MSIKSEKHQVLVDFGARVRHYRKARGYSQEAFADACEIDRSYMGGVERGERNLALINIVRIIEALAMEPSAFFRDLDSDRCQELRAQREAERTLRSPGARLKSASKMQSSGQ